MLFSGDFKGGNYDVSNMLIKETNLNQTTYQGLFGYVNRTLIEGVRVRSIDITINNTATTGSTYVGGLVAYNMTKVSENYTSGTIDVTSVNTSYVGGLVGYGYGALAHIEENYSKAIINVTVGTTTNDVSGYMGGLMGYNNMGNITNAYAIGDVTAKALFGVNRLYVGGLLGYNVGTETEIKKHLYFKLCKYYNCIGRLRI